MTKLRGVIFIEKNRIQYIYYNAHLSLDIPQDIIRDGEVIFPDKLGELVTSFIQQNKIAPAELVMLLADDLTFNTTIKIEDAKTSEEQIQTFIDLVPFEDVSYREFVTPTEVTVIAANHDFIQIIKNAFIKQGFSIAFIISQLVLTKHNISTSYTIETINEVLKKFDTLQLSSLKTEQEQLQTEKKLQEEKNFYSTNIKPSTLALIGIFVFLLIVIVVMLVLNLRPVEPRTRQVQQTLPTPTITLDHDVPTPLIEESTDEQASVSAF